MAAGTSIITERSPYIARTSFTLAQSSVIIADWAVKNSIKKVVTMVSDYAPGADAEKSFSERFKAGGGEIVVGDQASRSPTRTSRRSCSAPPTPSPTRCSSSFRPARAAPS